MIDICGLIAGGYDYRKTATLLKSDEGKEDSIRSNASGFLVCNIAKHRIYNLHLKLLRKLDA